MRTWLALLTLGAASGWGAETQLFNGKDLTGWARIARHEGAPSDEKPGFVVRDGLLVSVPDAPEDDLWYTPRKIGNATLLVVYKVSVQNCVADNLGQAHKAHPTATGTQSRLSRGRCPPSAQSTGENGFQGALAEMVAQLACRDLFLYDAS